MHATQLAKLELCAVRIMHVEGLGYNKLAELRFHRSPGNAAVLRAAASTAWRRLPSRRSSLTIRLQMPRAERKLSTLGIS